MSTMFRGIRYALTQAFTQVFRNRAMTLASVFSITAMLLILGLFFILAVNVNMMTESAKQQFDTIQIYLLDETTEEQAKEIMENLEKMPEVDGTTYVDADQAMVEMKVRWGDNAYLLDTLAENPFPNSIRIKLADLEGSATVVAAASNLTGVKLPIKDNKDMVQQILGITNAVQTGALVIIVFLVVISVVVVSNTVKLTVLAREREIGIMKYVGATNWFIRGPFLAEGMVIGCISALVSSGVISFVYYKISELLGLQIIRFTALVPEVFLVKNLVWIFLALGVSIGAVGSIISMRRFLDT